MRKTLNMAKMVRYTREKNSRKGNFGFILYFFPLRRIEIEESESTSIHNVEWHECCVFSIGGS